MKVSAEEGKEEGFETREKKKGKGEMENEGKNEEEMCKVLDLLQRERKKKNG